MLEIGPRSRALTAIKYHQLQRSISAKKKTSLNLIKRLFARKGRQAGIERRSLKASSGLAVIASFPRKSHKSRDARGGGVELAPVTVVGSLKPRWWRCGSIPTAPILLQLCMHVARSFTRPRRTWYARARSRHVAISTWLSCEKRILCVLHNFISTCIKICKKCKRWKTSVTPEGWLDATGHYWRSRVVWLC